MKNKERIAYLIVILILSLLSLYTLRLAVLDSRKNIKINSALIERLIAADEVIHSDENYFLDVIVETDEYQKYQELINTKIE